MSGGYFDYADLRLRDEIFGFCDERSRISNPLEDMEISELVWDVLDLLHDFDYYRSGDTSEKNYLETKREFKYKWFAEAREERLKSILNEALIEVNNDFKKTLEIED